MKTYLPSLEFSPKQRSRKVRLVLLAKADDYVIALNMTIQKVCE